MNVISFISECNKFYSDIKSEFEIEPYLNLVENTATKMP